MIVFEAKIDEQHKEDQEEDSLHNKRTKFARTALEFGLGRAYRKPLRYIAEGSFSPGSRHQGGRRSANHRCAKKYHVMRIGWRGGRFVIADLFLRWQRFSGKRRLLDVQIFLSEEERIGRNEI